MSCHWYFDYFGLSVLSGYEMAQQVKCLLHKHEGLNLDFQSPHWQLVQRLLPVIPMLGRSGKRGNWRWLHGEAHCSILTVNECQGYWDPVSKNKGGQPLRNTQYQSLVFTCTGPYPYMCPHTPINMCHTPPFTHVHIPPIHMHISTIYICTYLHTHKHHPPIHMCTYSHYTHAHMHTPCT